MFLKKTKFVLLQHVYFPCNCADCYQAIQPLHFQSFISIQNLPCFSLHDKLTSILKHCSCIVVCSHITEHFPFNFSLRNWDLLFLASGLRVIVLLFSICSSSWNSSLTLWLVFADVSMKAHCHCFASASPRLVETSRLVSSHLLPTNITGMPSMSPLISQTSLKIGLSSSSDCLDVMEYTKMKAWPFEMDRRCIAGNWWLPVVSVIWRVHTCLLQLMTCLYVSSIVGM